MSQKQNIAKFIQDLADGNYASAEQHLIEAAESKAIEAIEFENVTQSLIEANMSGDATSIMNTIISKLQDKGGFVKDPEVIKNTALTLIKTSNIPKKTKIKMMMAIQSINSANKLYQYIYNSLLKFQGQGVVNPGDRY